MIEHRSGAGMRQIFRQLFRAKRGNVAVEAALIFLPFFAMIFAIMDFAMVFFLQGTFKHAAREGVRYAITQRVEEKKTQKESIQAQVQKHAMGFLAGDAGLKKIDIKFYQLDQTAAKKGYIEVTGPGRNAANNIVEVTISPCTKVDFSDCFRWGWMAPLQASPDHPGRGTNPWTIRARATDRMESPPGDILPTW
jgi:hypothetical protein